MYSPTPTHPGGKAKEKWIICVKLIEVLRIEMYVDSVESFHSFCAFNFRPIRPSASGRTVPWRGSVHPWIYIRIYRGGGCNRVVVDR